MAGLYGLLGKKLEHSISPKIHSLIFRELSIDGCYHLFEVDEDKLKDAVFGLAAVKAKGVNVTIPYKVQVMDYLHHISPEAKKIGSVNTICFSDGYTAGCNTDYYGFGMMLDRNGIDVKGKTAVILGTGGAARGGIQYLVDNGIKDLILVSRDISTLKNTDKLKDFNAVSYDKINTLKDTDIIINCTPCGMHPNTGSSPVEKCILNNFSTAVDLIYNPKETLFLKYARESGLKAVNGLYMLVGQAAAAQEIWNNIKISTDIVDRIYNSL